MISYIHWACLVRAYVYIAYIYFFSIYQRLIWSSQHYWCTPVFCYIRGPGNFQHTVTLFVPPYVVVAYSSCIFLYVSASLRRLTAWLKKCHCKYQKPWEHTSSSITSRRSPLCSLYDLHARKSCFVLLVKPTMFVPHRPVPPTDICRRCWTCMQRVWKIYLPLAGTPSLTTPTYHRAACPYSFI